MERDEITMMVARNIEALMKARGLDPAKLARKAKINPTGVYDILSGKSRSPKIETIGKIAKALEVPVSAVFEDRPTGDQRQDFLFLFESLPASQRELLIQTARAWLPTQQSA